MPASIQELLDAGCCETREYLEGVFRGREALTAAEMLAETGESLERRAWAIQVAAKSLDWPAITAALYRLINASRYSRWNGIMSLAEQFGDTADVAMVHVVAYSAEVGDSSLMTQAEGILAEAVALCQ